MSQIMRLRVILDTEDDVFRDIEIETTAPLMHLHFAVLDAFGWESGWRRFPTTKDGVAERNSRCWI